MKRSARSVIRAPHERAATDFAAEITELFGLLVGDAHRLHGNFDAVGEIAMRRHPRAGREHAALDIDDDPVGQTLMLSRASPGAEIGRPCPLAPRAFLSSIADATRFRPSHYAAPLKTLPDRRGLT